METILLWLPYFLLGLVGVLYHIWSKPESGGVWEQTKSRNTMLSLLAYCVLMFMWWDGTLEVLSIAPEPSALSFVLGYFAQSILGHIIKQVGSKLQGEKKDSDAEDTP
jgi:hypothetical protein